MTYNIMIDFETLDTTATAAVLSLGAALFTPDKILSANYVEFDLDFQLPAGRTVSASTLAWWMTQSSAARAVFTGKAKRYLTADVLADFFSVLEGGHLKGVKSSNPFYDVRLWSNGASFDIPILEHIYRATGVKSPFHYGHHTCFRTFANLTKCRDLVPDLGVKHNALDDAKWQAETVIAWHAKNKKAKK